MGTDLQLPATSPPLDHARSNVDVDLLLKDLRLVEKGFHRTNTDEGPELVDFGHGAVDDLVVFHAEDDGIEADLLVDGAVAVNDSTTADWLVVGGDKDEAVLLIKTAFEGGHRETVDVLVQRGTTAHVLRRNTDGVFLLDNLVHRLFPPGSLAGAGNRLRPSPAEASGGSDRSQFALRQPVYEAHGPRETSIGPQPVVLRPSRTKAITTPPGRPSLMERNATLRAKEQAIVCTLLLMLLLQPFMGVVSHGVEPLQAVKWQANTEGMNDVPQPWPQFMGSATRNGSMPAHGPDGGPGQGAVENVSVLGTIDDPVLNWASSDGEGSSTYGSLVLDLEANIARESGANTRCAEGMNFVVVIETGSDGTSHTLKLVSGNAARIAWEVDLGDSSPIRSTPVAADIEGDGDLELVVVSDGPNGLEVEAWSPELECDAAGWQRTGHSNERLWTWSDADLTIGTTSPHWPSDQSGHQAVTQPLLEDVDLDGVPDLVLAVVDTTTEDPTLLALPLTSSAPGDPLWEVTLDRGTHPSDPAAVKMDANSVAVVVTTIDDSTGAMWVWKADGDNGALDWERTPVPDTDQDSDAPRLRLPGPVIVQLDGDVEPEVVLTVPTDGNGRDSGSGARFIGMDLTSTQELFSFRTPNGYADAPPLPVDTDNDGIHDRLCWITWYSVSISSFDREGLVGCHDLTVDPAQKSWSRSMNRGGGTDNDEIAVSPPIWMDIDGDGPAEVVVAFGRKIHALDGESGSPADVSTPWEDPLSLPHRTWAAIAPADVDGDGTLDLVIGDMVVSQRAPDLAPLSDGRAIQFTPADPAPGESVTVSARLENIGTETPDDEVDAWLYMGQDIIGRFRADTLDPIDPSGDGATVSFAVATTAVLGTTEFTLVLDPLANISEAREDNNIASTTLTVQRPYAVDLVGPNEPVSGAPGSLVPVTVDLTSIGTREGTWTIDIDTSGLPPGWELTPTGTTASSVSLAPQQTVALTWNVAIDEAALGDEEGWFDLSVVLDGQPEANATLRVPVEVLRTRGLDLEGPDGTSSTRGHGLAGSTAEAWFSIENLGNAQDTTTSIDWDSSAWGSPRVETSDGVELFTITLAPGEFRVLKAAIDVPTGTAPGSVQQVDLTVCVGEGEETLCRTLDVTFAAATASNDPGHHRTFPDVTVSYAIDVELPSSGSVTWNTTDLSTLGPSWPISVDGAVMNATGLHVNGNPGSTASFVLSVDVPPTAVPRRHAWILHTDNINEGNITLSLQVLQRHLTSLALIQPTNGTTTTVYEVGQQHDITVRVTNPGNDVDTYAFEGFLDPAPTAGSVSLSTPTPTKTVAPGGSSIMTMRLLLDEDVPALEAFEVVLKVTSAFNSTATDELRISVAAAPERAWTLEVEPLPSLVQPSQQVVVRVNATNIGNTPDELHLTLTHEVEHIEGDMSQWTSSEHHASSVGIGETVSANITVNVPDQVWNGTVSVLHVSAIWENMALATTNHTFEVARQSGWRINLSDIDLIVAPEGGFIHVPLDHLGNSVQDPWFVKVAEGWSVSVPQNGSHVAPYGSSTVLLNVTPPNGTEAGDVGTVNLRISDGDGNGASEHQIPVRVAAAAGLEVRSEGAWWVSDNGGWPLVWANNTGNDVARIDLDVTGVPDGWTVVGPSFMVLAPGSVAGVPISLLPSSDWDGSGLLVGMVLHHPSLDPVEIQLEVRSRSVAFASSPVLVGMQGGVVSVALTDGGTVDHTLVAGLETIDLSSDGFKIIQLGYPEDGIDVSCRFVDSVEELGRQASDATIVECEGTSDGTSTVSWSVYTEEGVPIPLDSSTRSLHENTTSWSINLSDWRPDPGPVRLHFLIHDERGNVLNTDSFEAIARASGWNLGVDSFRFEGSEAVVGIRRTNVGMLEETPCLLTFEGPGGRTSSHLVDVSGDFAPTLRIDLASLALPADAEVKVTLRCEAPFDVDDDGEDDQKAAIHRGGVDFGLGNGGWVWSLGALLVVALVGRLLLPQPERARLKPQPSAPAKQAPSTREEVAVAPDTTEEVVVMVSEVEDVEPDEGEDPTEDDTKPVQQPEAGVHGDDASSRLARLRGEMDGEGDAPAAPKEDLESRMARFFGE